MDAIHYWNTLACVWSVKGWFWELMYHRRKIVSYWSRIANSLFSYVGVAVRCWSEVDEAVIESWMSFPVLSLILVRPRVYQVWSLPQFYYSVCIFTLDGVFGSQNDDSFLRLNEREIDANCPPNTHPIQGLHQLFLTVVCDCQNFCKRAKNDICFSGQTWRILCLLTTIFVQDLDSTIGVFPALKICIEMHSSYHLKRMKL